jgi:hypothetical protein
MNDHDLLETDEPPTPQRAKELAREWLKDAEYLIESDGDLLQPPRTPVEVYVARWRVQNGFTSAGNPAYTPGRFLLREHDHHRLCAGDAAYGVVVYEQSPHGIIPVHERIVPAGEVDELLPDEPWHDADRVSDGVHRLSWPTVFPDGGGI